jgi:hypothetical protein
MIARAALLVFPALLASGCMHAGATAATDPCPATLPGQAEAAALGFRAMTDSTPPRPTAIAPGAKAALSNVRFSDGPPEELAWLAPSEERTEESIWRFIPTAGRQTHLTCAYGANAPMLSKPLTARTCTVRFGASNALKSLACD